MTQVETQIGGAAARPSLSGWSELWRKEDWWAVWLGLAIVIIGLFLFSQGGSWRWVAVLPPRWTSLAQLSQHFAGNWLRYVSQFVLWYAAFSAALKAMGRHAREFLPAFAFVYVLSVLVFIAGQWDVATYYGFEAPLVALLVGLIIANVIGLPKWLDAAFRVEFYIKTAIVLLGAT